MLLLPQRLRRLFGRPLRLGWFDHPTMHAYRPPKHPDSPERVAAVEAELRRQGIWPHLLQIQGKEATDSQIALAHSRSYLFRLEGMQPQTGKICRIDDDTVLTDNALEAARIAAGTVIKAVDFVLAGKIRNAFCATRPPGHHAKSKQSGSFCLINHTAVPPCTPFRGTICNGSPYSISMCTEETAAKKSCTDNPTSCCWA